MKYMNMKKKYQSLDLQIFADEGGENGSNGDDSGEGDDPDEHESEENGEGEKKFSQKDIDEAIKKRLAREKRRWQREQQKLKPEGDDVTEKSQKEDKETKVLKEKAAKADDLELKWTCLEHDVDKACVDDVIALAKVHMAKDEKMDIEDAIDAVLKKYPQFKESSKDDEDTDDTPKGAWGERQNGKPKKLSGVEEAFLKKNPGLKID